VGLTSPVLPYLLAAATAMLLVVILVTWPRLARRRFLPVMLRIVGLLVLQVLSLGLIFVIVNRANEFYASWQDLLGSNKSPAHVAGAPATTVTSQQPLVVLKRTAVHVAGYPAASGTLESVQVHGPLSGITATGHIYLPAGYTVRAHRRYPVLIAISNARPGSSSPYAAGQLADNAAVQISTHAMPPMIIAMLPAAVSPRDHACLNVPPTFRKSRLAAPAVLGETFFAQDVPAVLASSYPVGSQPGDWALLGDASGGYCALQLALDNSFAFSAAVVPRGAYAVPPGRGAVPDNPLFREQDSLLWQLSHLPMPSVSVLFAGPGQQAGPGAAAAFLASARPPLDVSFTALPTGRWPLAQTLDWIGTALSQESGRKV
jgi:Putative esterase